MAASKDRLCMLRYRCLITGSHAAYEYVLKSGQQVFHLRSCTGFGYLLMCDLSCDAK